MDQKNLRNLESYCIQEERPACQAACPLHLDARSLVSFIGKGSWDQAIKIINSFLPVPEILARICDQVCQKACLRNQKGGAIRIGDLERFLVENMSPPKGVMPLSPKSETIAIYGSEISGLSAAWDLLFKGFQVTLYETSSKIAPQLAKQHQDRLPRKIIESQVQQLVQLGLKIELNSPKLSQDFLEEILKSHQGLMIDLVGLNPSYLEEDPFWDALIVQDPVLRNTQNPAIFVAGDSKSVVLNAAQGRYAALSLERTLQKVSLTAGRSQQAPHETRLFTDISHEKKAHPIPMADPLKGFTQKEAQAEAERCFDCQCLMCVNHCEFLKEFGGYPKTYLREIYNNDSIVMGQHQANTMINSCSLCELCTKLCPNDFPMAQVILKARQKMVQKGKMPPSAHEFALQDMEYSAGEKCSLAKHAPKTQKSEYVFFPGCQLSASLSKTIDLAYDYLRNNLSANTGLMLNCCGAIAKWAGQTEKLEQHTQKINQDWELLGKPTIIVACPTCFQTFKQTMQHAPVITLWEILDQTPPTISPDMNISTLALHDPCTARDMPHTQQAVRSLLRKANIKIKELPLHGELSQCCGFGGLMQNANPELAKKTAEQRSSQSNEDFITYCAMCRDNLANTNKPTAHILDILFAPQNEKNNPFKPWPTWSIRRENRGKLKRDLLRDIWRERTPEMEEWENIKLIMEPDVKEKLDQRRILDEDLKQVINHAEKSQDFLKHRETGNFLAGYKPMNVTFWVEYTKEKEIFRIHNAYCHRMTVISGDKS